MVNEEEEPFNLRPAQVARELGVSTSAVKYWVKRGYIPCRYTLGGHSRYRRSDVDALKRTLDPSNY